MAEHASVDTFSPPIDPPSNPNFLDSNLFPDDLESEIDLDFDFDGIDWNIFSDDLIFPEDPNLPSQTSRIINTSSPESDHSAKCSTESIANLNQEEKKKARLMRNRQSAQLSRQRKKEHVEELEEKVRSMNSLIAELNSKISFIMAENLSLKQQLGFSGFPPVFVYSSVPMVPIPKLKSQQAIKKTEKEKRRSKIRKVGSITLLGFLFVVFMFAGFVSRLDRRYEESRNYGVVAVKNGLLDNPNGMVLSVSNRVSSDEFGFKSGRSNREVDNRLKDKSSESLPALLYISRNGKHVEIDGELIINSVLASERAVMQVQSRDQFKQPFGNDGVEKGLVIANLDSGVPLSIKSYGSSTEYQQALANDSEDAFMDVSQDGFLQQWFREGMAGPIFNSGTCTEVFQFQISPSSSSPSAVITSPSTINATETAISNSNTTKTSSSSTHQTVIKNRRFLHTQPIPLTSSTVNNTEHIEKRSERTNFQNNSSMVVSVLIDPREISDGEGMISPKKSLQRIFVVILLDSVKYVTYSCVLPFKGHSSHLVN